MDYKIPHGHVLFKGKDTTYNKKFDVTCEKGYELAGEKQTTCLADGKWSKHTACLPVGMFQYSITNLCISKSVLLIYMRFFF